MRQAHSVSSKKLPRAGLAVLLLGVWFGAGCGQPEETPSESAENQQQARVRAEEESAISAHSAAPEPALPAQQKDEASSPPGGPATAERKPDEEQEEAPPSRSELERRMKSLPTSQRIAFITHYRQGLELARLYQIERALAEVEQCLAIVPDHPEPLFQKARLVLSTGRIAEAADYLERVVKIDTATLAPRRLLHELYSPGGPLPDERQASLQSQVIREICGDLSEFDRTLERWLRTGEGPNPQESLMRQADDFKADTSSPLGRLAHIYALREGAQAMKSPGLDHSLKADQRFRELVDEYPGLVGVFLEHGRWLLMTQIRFDLIDDPDEPPMDSSITLDIAQVYFERALDASPLFSSAAFSSLLHLGHVARDMGDFDEAAQIYELLLAQEGVPSRFQNEAYFNLGVVHYRTGQTEKARVSFKQSESIRPDPIIRWFLALTGESPLPLRPEAVDPESERTLKFVDVASELGVDKYDGAGPSAWCDTDLDGDLDLFVCGCDTFCILYQNEGGEFRDVSHQAGLGRVASGFSSTFADYDNDGDCDLYIGRNGWSGPARNSLYRNRGDGTFEEVTSTAGVGHPGSSFVHAWADFDRDGFLDLFVANGITKDGSTNCLYHNNGDGTFSDFTRAAGMAERPGIQTIGFGIGDYNRDGWPDLFVNSWGSRNRLYRNQGNGRFAEVATFAGVDGRRHPASGYLAFLSDFDNDTWPDILLTKLCPSFGMTIEGMLQDYQPTRFTSLYTTKLYRNKGDGWSFEDASDAAGLIYTHGSMGGNVADVNNDGYLDFYLGTGDPWLPRMEPNAFYLNTGKGGFVDLTRFTGLGHLGKGHGITFADYDYDGDLDIYAPQGGFVHGDLWHNALYRNERGNANNWLQVLLIGTRSNRMGVGAQLTLKSGDLTLYREMTAGGAFGSSSSPFVHFGLGGRHEVDRLEILWPSGLRQVHSKFPANRFVKVVESAAEIEFLSPGSTSKPTR